MEHSAQSKLYSLTLFQNQIEKIRKYLDLGLYKNNTWKNELPVPTPCAEFSNWGEIDALFVIKKLIYFFQIFPLIFWPIYIGNKWNVKIGSLLVYLTVCWQMRSNLRVHTEWRLPISGVHPIMMEKSFLAGESGGVHAHPLSAYYHHVQSCSVRSCERAGTHHPVSSLSIYVLCGSNRRDYLVLIFT